MLGIRYFYKRVRFLWMLKFSITVIIFMVKDVRGACKKEIETCSNTITSVREFFVVLFQTTKTKSLPHEKHLLYHAWY